MGYLFGICVEKNSELKENDPARKYKGRVVFQGNRVIDQFFDAGIFQDMGSAPATLEAAKIADFYGCAPGHEVDVADAEQAYARFSPQEIAHTEPSQCVPERRSCRRPSSAYAGANGLLCRRQRRSERDQ